MRAAMKANAIGRAVDQREVELKQQELEFLTRLAAELSRELTSLHARITMTAATIQAIQRKYEEQRT